MAVAHQNLFERLGRFVEGEVKAEAPLAPWTSVRVGGNAELWVRPSSPDSLVAMLRMARDQGVPVTVLGGGANTLVGDGGVPGITLKLPSDFLPEEKVIDSAGGRFTLGWWFTPCQNWGLEGSYFFLGTRNSSATIGTPGSDAADWNSTSTDGRW